MLVLFATQLAATLAASSVLAADAHAAARQVAGREVDHLDDGAIDAARERAAAWLADRVAPYGQVEVLRIDVGGEQVRLHVVVRVRQIARVAIGPAPDARIRRTVVTMVEQA